MADDLKTDLSLFQSGMVRAEKPFVSYRLPGEHLPFTIFGSSDFKRFDHISDVLQQPPGFVLAPYEPGKPLLWLQAENLAEGFRAVFPMPDIPDLDIDEPGVPDLHIPDQAEYELSVARAIAYIREGKAGKVVLSRPMVHEWPDAAGKAGELFALLCSSYPRAFVYLAHIPGMGLWAGASPEILLTSRNGQFSTMSLSGTRKKGNPDEAWGSKEIGEHRWVTRFIEESLKDTGCTGVVTTPMHSAVAGEMEHLRTNFSGQCSHDKLPGLIEALHPTPAVCGWPTPVARAIIRELEPYDRSFYTGFLGPVTGPADFSLFVNLRCMQINGRQTVIYAGGGITADSDPHREWEETVLKSRTMLSPIEKLANFTG